MFSQPGVLTRIRPHRDAAPPVLLPLTVMDTDGSAMSIGVPTVPAARTTLPAGYVVK